MNSLSLTEGPFSEIRNLGYDQVAHAILKRLDTIEAGEHRITFTVSWPGGEYMNSCGKAASDFFRMICTWQRKQ